MAQFDTEEIVIGGTEWKTAPFRFNRMLTIGGSDGPSYIEVLLSGVSPLVLTNAIELNYLKLFGNTEQRNIPNGYTQVEYLESSGGQKINTGLTGNDNYTIRAKFYDFGGGANCVISGSDSHYGTNYIGRVSGSDSSYRMLLSNKKSSDITASIGLHTVEVNPQKITFDGTDYSWSADNNSTGQYLYLFYGYYSSELTARMRLYYYQVELDGVLLRNFIPAKRNSDNVLGMFDTITDTFFTNSGTGTFTAGADVTTPTPNTPIDIVCNNGVLKVNKNLFNETWEQGAISSTQGVSYSTAKTSMSTRIRTVNEIYLDPIKTYTISINNSNLEFVIQVFDSQHRLYTITDVSNVWGTSPKTITGAYGVAVALRYKNSVDILPTEGQNSKIQLELGSTATTYAPYSPNGIYADGTTETVEVHGKNLLNNPVYTRGYLSNNGIIAGADGTVLNFYPVSPNTTYTFTYTRGTNNNYYDRICGYSSNNVSTFTELLVQKDFRSYSIGDRLSSTFTTGANTNYIAVGMLCGNSSGVAPTDAQLELGSTATAYEPYTLLGTATAEMLLKIGSYQDVQSVLDGEVTRNVGIKVLDGTENWGYSGGVDNAFFLTGSEGQISGAALYCTHFKGVSVLSADLQIRTGSSWKFLVRYNAINKDYTTFKQYLASQYNAGTPVIIVYPLATPTTETVTAQPLTVQTGTNIVTITQASIDNLTMELSYKQST